MALPRPPRSVFSGRPLPPDPVSGGDDAPPPLPSRPAASSFRNVPAPPKTNGHPPSPAESGDEEYIEPMPPIPAYIPPSKSVQKYVPPPEEHVELTYDDLEDVIPDQQAPEQQEVYDECELKPEMTPVIQEDNIYEVDPEAEEPVADELYEFVTDEASSNVPKVPQSLPPQRQAAPAPAPPTPPSLPPSRPKPAHQDPPEPVPGRNPAGKKKISGDGAIMLGIGKAEIGAQIQNLKRVQKTPKEDTKIATTRDTIVENNEATSVKDRIERLKNQEKAGKPVLPVKPYVESPKSPTSLVSPVSPPPFTKQATPATVAPAKPPPVIPQEVDEELYDDCSTFFNPLLNEEWYHGGIDRNSAKSRLHSIGQDGTFLVRDSTSGSESQPFTLMVLYQDHIYNLEVRKRDDAQVALGKAKPDELAFSDVLALVSHHKGHEVILVRVKENSQYKTLLKRHPIAIRGVNN